MTKNILSLFDGISVGQLALKECGIKYDNYYASEIDSNAILVTKTNFPNTIQLGDVRNINVKDLPPIWLLMGGSPCQDFSISGKRNGMKTKNGIEITSYQQYLELKKTNHDFIGSSFLFWEFIRLYKELKPKYVFLENVKMSKQWENIISKELTI